MTEELNLPLSWNWIQQEADSISRFKLSNNRIWITSASLHTEKNESFLEILSNFKEKNLLIRGLNESQKNLMCRKGFEALYSGLEAEIDLNNYINRKKSLIELIKRGLKKGSVIEYSVNKITEEKINDLLKHSRHSDEPKLKYLFQTEINENIRIFVLEDRTKNLLGGITISRNSKTKYHAELLIKRKGAPVGVMEALIDGVCLKLIDEGVAKFSLGEVPLIVNKPLKLKGKFIHLLGKILSANYNYKGLFNFKNKFNPNWKPLYICAYPKIYYSDLVKISIASNLFRLFLFRFRKLIS